MVSGDMTEPVRQYLMAMRSTLQDHINHGRPREETAVYSSQFMSMFPSHHLPEVWLKQQIKRTLDLVYDELQINMVPDAGQLPIGP